MSIRCPSELWPSWDAEVARFEREQRRHSLLWGRARRCTFRGPQRYLEVLLNVPTIAAYQLYFPMQHLHLQQSRTQCRMSAMSYQCESPALVRVRAARASAKRERQETVYAHVRACRMSGQQAPLTSMCRGAAILAHSTTFENNVVAPARRAAQNSAPIVVNPYAQACAPPSLSRALQYSQTTLALQHRCTTQDLALQDFA